MHLRYAAILGHGEKCAWHEREEKNLLDGHHYCFIHGSTVHPSENLTSHALSGRRHPTSGLGLTINTSRSSSARSKVVRSFDSSDGVLPEAHAPSGTHARETSISATKSFRFSCVVSDHSTNLKYPRHRACHAIKAECFQFIERKQNVGARSGFARGDTTASPQVVRHGGMQLIKPNASHGWLRANYDECTTYTLKSRNYEHKCTSLLMHPSWRVVCVLCPLTAEEREGQDFVPEPAPWLAVSRRCTRSPFRQGISRHNELAAPADPKSLAASRYIPLR